MIEATVVTLLVVSVAALWPAVGRLLDTLQPDLGVYYYAYELHDDLYGENIVKPIMPIGGLPFTYTPFAALLFRPLSAIPFDAAVSTWALINSAAVAAVVAVLFISATRFVRISVTALALMATPTAAHLMLGQLNALLALAVVADLFLISRPHVLSWVPRGALIGLAAAVKLTPAIVIIFLLATRRSRPAFTAMATAVSATAVGFAIYPQSTIDFIALLPHLGERVDVLGYFATPQNTGVVGLLAQMGIASPAVSIGVNVLVVSAGVLVASRFCTRDMAGASLVLLLTASAATPVTWVHHWVTLPAALAFALTRHPSQALRIGLIGGLITQVLGSALLAAPERINYLPLPLDEAISAIWASSPVWSALLSIMSIARPRSGAQMGKAACPDQHK